MVLALDNIFLWISNNNLIICIYVHVIFMCATKKVWRSENSFQESGFSFVHTVSEDGTQIFFNPRSHLACPIVKIFFFFA